MSIAYREHVKSKKDKSKKPKDFCKVDCDPSEENGWGAKQEFKDECDMNFILKNLKKTGVLSHLNDRQAMYQEIEVTDLQTAMNTVMEAEGMFNQLPAALRKELGNDPIKFVELCQDKSDAAEALLNKYGLRDLPEPEKISKVEIINPPNSSKNDDLTTKSE